MIRDIPASLCFSEKVRQTVLMKLSYPKSSMYSKVADYKILREIGLKSPEHVIVSPYLCSDVV